ncbi:class I SAM-dependent methyltransferase [Burkholderia lata]|uniref:Type 12 methyltransferase n=1 Tax=Burkholderia lata (strain ATCC 17760 / DSM 23089 / LMG 22485 / NCIMB 9086 / R18194 / 383) TaxID=482957 RepID=A0A6P2S544_BURL3|nr:class I SAM-dependent methyltransferase [Burkholderia lata]VWC37916.1 type 12 methyltransferase [Burkholderia lata]
MHASRDYNAEALSRPEKKYSYNFDEIVRRYMMRRFAPFFGNGPALELGCHEGQSTLLLAERFDDLTVVEASSEAIDVAQKCVGPSVRFINSTFENAELEARFESIFLINTLEHVDEPNAILTRIRQWLRPGGRFFVLVPNADAPSRQIAVQMGLIRTNNAVTSGEWTHGHRRTYSFDTLEADLREAGFSIEQRGGLMFKALANFQFDKALEAGIIDEQYLDGIYQLGMIYPAMTASIYMICTA